MKFLVQKNKQKQKKKKEKKERLVSGSFIATLAK